MLLLLLIFLFAGVSAEKNFEFDSIHFNDARNPHGLLKKAVMSNPAVPVSNDDSGMAVGTLFVFSFLNSHLSANDQSYTENLLVTVTNPGARAATVNIYSLFPGFNNQTVTVPPNTSHYYNITPVSIQVDYMDTQSTSGTAGYKKENKAIWVTSDNPIKLVATNQLTDGSGEDKFAVLPVCQLGLNYMAVVDESARITGSSQSTNIISIIATEDGTTVQYTGLLLGVANLNKGESYNIVTVRPVSSVGVISNKPVAVISGAVCGYGYYNVPQIHCSHEALMLYPSSAFDVAYPYFKYQPEDAGEIMVYGTQDNTTVSADGYPFYVLNSGYFLIMKVMRGIYLTANNPIYVVGSGTINSNDMGAPFLAHVPGPSMFTGGPVLFATALSADEAQNMVHFARVVTSLDYIGSIAVDGYVANGLLYTRMGASNYYFYDFPLKIGDDKNHRVQANGNGATFAVTVYGYGMYRSYAFNPAMNLPITGTC